MIRMLLLWLALVLMVTTCRKNTPAEGDTVVLTIDTVTQTALPPAAEPVVSWPRYDYDTTQWLDLHDLDTTLLFDIRYATTNNFVKEQMYPCGRCWLRPPVARAIVAAHRELQAEGLSLLLFDCYRPRAVQYKLWEKVPDPRYVADPDKGSAHNRGGAVDLTIADSNNIALEMGTPYDFFGREAYTTYTDHPAEVNAHRERLYALMEAHGFRRIRTEWWHFSWTGKTYPLSEPIWPCPMSAGNQVGR